MFCLLCPLPPLLGLQTHDHIAVCASGASVHRGTQHVTAAWHTTVLCLGRAASPRLCNVPRAPGRTVSRRTLLEIAHSAAQSPQYYPFAPVPLCFDPPPPPPRARPAPPLLLRVESSVAVGMGTAFLPILFSLRTAEGMRTPNCGQAKQIGRSVTDRPPPLYGGEGAPESGNTPSVHPQGQP